MVDISYLLKFPIPSFKVFKKYLDEIPLIELRANKFVLFPKIIFQIGNPLQLKKEFVEQGERGFIYSFDILPDNIPMVIEYDKIVYTDEDISFTPSSSAQFTITKDNKLYYTQGLN